MSRLAAQDPKTGLNIEAHSEADSLLKRNEYRHEFGYDVDVYIGPFRLPSWWYLSQKSTSQLIRSILAVSVFLLFAILIRGFSQGSNHLGREVTVPVELGFSMSRSPYPPLASLPYLPWDAVIEPHRAYSANISHIKLSKGDGYITLNNKELSQQHRYLNITWRLKDLVLYGPCVNIKLTELGIYSLTISVVDNRRKGAVVFTHRATVAVKYIRREIRSLTEADRKEFFSALHTMYTTSAHAGNKMYGSDFRSADQLVYKHLTAAGTTDCDHWHDGAGLVTNHAAFTLEAERSLQAINPALSMAYWEYPMDAFLYTDANFGNSPLFRADWFGESSPANAVHQVSEGPWAEVTIRQGKEAIADAKLGLAGGWDELSNDGVSLNPYVNALGQLRSPWNSNPAYGISRHNLTYGAFSQLGRPGCAAMSSCYASESFAQMSDCLNGYTHGPVHILIGGSWAEGRVFDSDQEFNLRFLQKASKMLLFKMLWRYGWARCPTTCEARRLSSKTSSRGPIHSEQLQSEDDDESDDSAFTSTHACSCSVPQEYIDEYGVDTILRTSGVLDALKRDLSMIPRSVNQESLRRAILGAIQDPGIVGDMLTSAAPQDPLFWPLHGSIERLLGLKRISIKLGLIEESNFDMTWGYETDNFLYLRGRCDWSAVQSQDDLTLPTCEMGENVICEGHGEDDTLHFLNLLGKGETYTNREMMELIHPWNEDLPYTYDSYDYDYCYDMYPSSKSADGTNGFSFDSLRYSRASRTTQPAYDGLQVGSGM